MELTVKQKIPGCADGEYHICAPGSAYATLHWSDGSSLLPGWSPLGCISLDEKGKGFLTLGGGRAIPLEASCVQAIAYDAQQAQQGSAIAPVSNQMAVPGELPLRLLMMTDLHLSKKPWKVRQALERGQNYDAVLITGDITNDGTQQQLELFYDLVCKALPQTPVLAVTGNHDQLPAPLPRIPQGICEYGVLQEMLLQRAEEMGVACYDDESGAYVATFKGIRVVGLNAATHWRRFKFPEGNQLRFLNNVLSVNPKQQTIILCHAPVNHHRPYRKESDQPYLSRDKTLREILSKYENFLFLSGHTHLSMQNPESCVDRDENGNIYLNGGSVRPTTMKEPATLLDKDYAAGNVVEILLWQNGIQICGISLTDGKRMARAYWHFER